MSVKSLRLSNIGPFDDVHFDFDEKVNMLVGPNNCGKSTVLMALGELLVYPFVMPAKLYRKKICRYEIELNVLGKRKIKHKGTLPELMDNLLGLLKASGYTAFVPLYG